MTNFDKVKQFHNAFNHPVADKPALLTSKRTAMRLGLIEEEVNELREAISLMQSEHNRSADIIVDMADALGDILYVAYGFAAELGVDIDAVFDEIHASNMSKLGDDGKPIYREDGKILKGKNYQPPDIEKVVFG